MERERTERKEIEPPVWDPGTPKGIKPGNKSTEFWVTLGGTILAALIGAGYLPTGEQLQGTMVDEIVAIAGMILLPFGYTLTRGAVKAQEAKKSGVLTTVGEVAGGPVGSALKLLDKIL